MSLKVHRVAEEARLVVRTIYEEITDERKPYRSDIRRLCSHQLTLPFADYEHFLERYGYLTLDRRSDLYELTLAGREISEGTTGRMKTLNDDTLFHFQQEIDAGRFDQYKVQAGKRFDQQYIRFEGIGRGSVGSVWRAEHIKTGAGVAIKTLEGIDELLIYGRKNALKKQVEEVLRLQANLKHPFISPITDINLHYAVPYYVMPLCRGGNLRALLNQGSLEPEYALNLFAQLCLALEHAHHNGLFHQDLKPENILLTEQGNIQLFDFSLSRSIAKQVSQLGRQSYVGYGSVAYMPPELMRDPLLKHATIDIYALGLIFYEMLTGHLPGRRSPMPSQSIDGLPLAVDQLFDQMTQDAPNRRPQSMQEVIILLNKIEPFDRFAERGMMVFYTRAPMSLMGLTPLDIPEPVITEPEPQENNQTHTSASTQANIPVSTQTSAPSTQTSAPSTQISAPSTQSSTPSAQTSAPSTQTSAPSTQTSAPSTQSSTPSTQSSTPSTQSSTLSTQSSTPSTQSNTQINTQASAVQPSINSALSTPVIVVGTQSNINTTLATLSSQHTHPQANSLSTQEPFQGNTRLEINLNQTPASHPSIPASSMNISNSSVSIATAYKDASDTILPQAVTPFTHLSQALPKINTAQSNQSLNFKPLLNLPSLNPNTPKEENTRIDQPIPSSIIAESPTHLSQEQHTRDVAIDDFLDDDENTALKDLEQEELKLEQIDILDDDSIAQDLKISNQQDSHRVIHEKLKELRNRKN